MKTREEIKHMLEVEEAKLAKLNKKVEYELFESGSLENHNIYANAAACCSARISLLKEILNESN